ncbi:ATP-binding protein [Candidatus Cryosericum hinesii]|uniref:ATP-binding protein n=1 Tax=Candidatus Cryosericum hinesii TaxID=2290915 RepID=A0ABX9MBX2_9BACT|nr:ATP-binding protein [Candidatus Cryosericum hinesii]
MAIRLFDLNIEEVLEDWEVEHAMREVIANALDEQTITKTSDITISKDSSGDWHIRDFGRGLQIEHFTLNENKEKLDAQSGVIGKFGVGLKDALATFHRRSVDVVIRSSAGTFRLKEECKHGFDNIITLHVEYDGTKEGVQGTDFALHGVTDESIAKAKSFFMKFSGEEVLEATAYGQILRRRGDVGRIYIMGVFANEEPNFLFSYNVSSLTDAMKKRLNRERLNVGRTTYADRVKTILKSARSKTVQDLLAEQVQLRASGTQCDEMSWIEISQMALNLLHQQNHVAYFTEQQLASNPDIADHVKSDGLKVVVISEQQQEKLQEQSRSGGPTVRTMDEYIREFNESFQFKFVDAAQLTEQERHVYDCTDRILSLVGLSSHQVPPIRISETMRITTNDTGGLWEMTTRTIIIKRAQLLSFASYAGVLLHEVAHVISGTADVTRDFESLLTKYLGQTSAAAIENAPVHRFAGIFRNHT